MRSGRSNAGEVRFRIFQGRILTEYQHIVGEYGLTEIDATESIGEQQLLVRELIDETLADYRPPTNGSSVEEYAAHD